MRKVILFLCMCVGAALLFSCASAPQTDGFAAPVSSDAARDKAQAAMEKARSVRADIAVMDDFTTGQATFNLAQSLSGEAAIAKYQEAEKLFLAAHDTTVAKREEANKQLEKARNDIKALEQDVEMFKQGQGGV